MIGFSYDQSACRRQPMWTATALAGPLCLTLALTGCTQAQQAMAPGAVASPTSAASAPGESISAALKQMESATVDDKLEGLRKLADYDGKGAQKQKADYVAARLLQQRNAQDDYEEGIARFFKAADYAPLKQLSFQHAADWAKTRGDEQTVRRALEALAADQTVDKNARAGALYGLGQSYSRTGDKERARQHFTDARLADPQSEYALGASYYLASADLAESKPGAVVAAAASETASDPRAQAIAAYRHYLRLSPYGRFAGDIADALASLPDFKWTAEDHALVAETRFAHGRYKEALAEWQKAGKAGKWFQESVCLQKLGRTSEARQKLLAGISANPDDDCVEEAATLLAKLSTKQEASDMWKLIATKSIKFADIGLYNVGIRAGSPAAAAPYYRTLISKYPQSRYASEATWWLAWQAIQSGQTQTALRLLQDGVTHYPNTRAGSRFAYWVGKMHERAGQKQAARAAYQQTVKLQPWNYYAYRAQSRLAALNGGRDQGWQTDKQRKIGSAGQLRWSLPEAPPESIPQDKPALAVLTDMRQWDECLELVGDDNQTLKSFYLAQLNKPLPSINAAMKDLHGNPTGGGNLWQLAYPLWHRQVISAEAGKKGVDPYLVQALIREESRYDHRAVSSSNALGLMQLLPGTAYGVAKRLGIKVNNHDDIHKPENNIRMGTDYLSYVQQRHDGNALFAVASYNGGPNAVARWRRTMPADTDVFVENIPFRETRDYVRKVFGSYWNYVAIYGNKPENVSSR